MLSVLYATRGKGIQNESGSNIFHYYQRKKLVPDILALISEESSEDSAEESTTNLPEMVKQIGLPKADDEAVQFIPSKSFCGAKPGYVYRLVLYQWLLRIVDFYIS
jgi:hypothetical protein